MVRKTQRTRPEDKHSSVVDVWLVPGDWYDYPTPTFHSVDEDDFIEGDLQISSGHPVSRLGERGKDIGGDFRVRKRHHESHSSLGDSPMHFSEEGGTPYHTDPMAHGITHHYYRPRAIKSSVTEGSFWPSPSESGASPSSFLTLDGKGTTAISRIIPTSPLFDAATQLGELREGYSRPKVESWQGRTAYARTAGSNYLATQFGWIPLISEMKSFFHSATKFKQICEQYEKNSGKLLHRRYDFPDEFEITHSEDTGISGYLPSPGLSGALFRPDHIGMMSRTRREKRRTWLEAVFTYYLPPLGTWQRELSLYNHAFGVIPSPETVWELTPWSWAIDWFTNTGDIMKNLHGFLTDGLVMPYAYIMEETSVLWEYSLTGVAYRSYPGMQSFTQRFEETFKQRHAATPFGFGVDMTGLNARQVAILAALGLQRL